MKPPTERIEVPIKELQDLLEGAREKLGAEGYRKLKAAIDTLEYLTSLIEDQTTTIQKLRELLSKPASTEKTEKVLENAGLKGEAKNTAGVKTPQQDGWPIPPPWTGLGWQQVYGRPVPVRPSAPGRFRTWLCDPEDGMTPLRKYAGVHRFQHGVLHLAPALHHVERFVEGVGVFDHDEDLQHVAVRAQAIALGVDETALILST